MKFSLGLIVLFLLVSISLNGQNKPFVIGETVTLNSTELGEERTLNIYLPDGYSKDSAATYPVIYLLDGSANEDFLHTAGLVQFLVMIGRIPPTIVVGIANVDRVRDFTTPLTGEQDALYHSIIKQKKDAFTTAGGSAKFIAFIEKELQPYIEKNYKLNGIKAIIGQSLGGLLATQILAEKPQLFNCYIIVSPSLWWNKQSLLTTISKPVAGHNYSNTKVCVLVGKEGKTMVGDAKALYKKLTKINGLSSAYMYLQFENHATILHNALYKSLGVIQNPKQTTP